MIELIKLLSYGTYIIYAAAIVAGVVICISAFMNLDRLKGNQSSSMMQPDNTPIHTVTRFMFGVFLIGSNMIAMYSLRSLGAEESYVTDPYAALGYIQGVQVSGDEKILALFALTLSRTIGALAITSGLKHGSNMSHPQEQVRQSARLRLMWAVPCSLIFIYPSWWIDIAATYYSKAAYFSGLIHGL